MHSIDTIIQFDTLILRDTIHKISATYIETEKSDPFGFSNGNLIPSLISGIITISVALGATWWTIRSQRKLEEDLNSKRSESEREGQIRLSILQGNETVRAEKEIIELRKTEQRKRKAVTQYREITKSLLNYTNTETQTEKIKLHRELVIVVKFANIENLIKTETAVEIMRFTISNSNKSSAELTKTGEIYELTEKIRKEIMEMNSISENDLQSY